MTHVISFKETIKYLILLSGPTCHRPASVSVSMLHSSITYLIPMNKL